ncbi:hypothetical protein HYPSUDRAFT_207282 [Hypholoma sublateritium FD-334 SS-4]|uniref:Uncharacterized protein n=1 Tax=Hypholoma sublateritium (strain FD-334 SS-4) TaxID=945553 RepID=A0A0D2KND8_HYPSF|nr:hypothetical protein HYPSUDRAFT_207282 [Hypholoma sublateritium FD-334 SS-4]
MPTTRSRRLRELRRSRRLPSSLPHPTNIQARRNGTWAGIVASTRAVPRLSASAASENAPHGACESFEARVGAVFFPPICVSLNACAGADFCPAYPPATHTDHRSARMTCVSVPRSLLTLLERTELVRRHNRELFSSYADRMYTQPRRPSFRPCTRGSSTLATTPTQAAPAECSANAKQAFVAAT